MKTFSYLLFIFFTGQFIFGQNLKFVNSDTNSPLENLIILDQEGNLIASTNQVGEIPENLISKNSTYTLSHPLIFTDVLRFEDIVDNTYYIEPIREVLLPEVNIQHQKTKELLVISGFFNSYVTNNGVFNIYVDGIIEYVFDRKTGKYKNSYIREYRSHILQGKVENKTVESMVLDDFLQIPTLKNYNKIIGNNTKHEKFYNSETDETLNFYKKIHLENKTMSLFGYTFSNLRDEEYFKFIGEDSNISNLLSYSYFESMDVKHKKENDLSTCIIISNFHPMDIYYANKNEISKGVKFDREQSNFKSEYWKNDYFSSIYDYLSQKFEDNFVLMDNKKSDK